MSDTNYAYSVARIRVLETKLLDKAKFNRMIEAKDAQEAFKVLMETDYNMLSSETHDAYDYELLLSKQLKNTYKLINDISPEPRLTELFFVKYDVHNLKALLKSKYTGANADSALMDMGTFSVDKIKQMVEQKDYRDLPVYIKDAAEQIEDIFSVQPKPHMIDIILDRALYRVYKEESCGKSHTFLKRYFGIQADLNNIKTFFRIKRGGYPKQLFEDVFLPGGKISKDVFLDNLDESDQVFADKLAVSDYGKVVAQYSNLTYLEKYADNYLFDYVKQVKGIPFGIQPLIGFILARENEVKNIRIIMVGKINQLPEHVIRERLRDTYA